METVLQIVTFASRLGGVFTEAEKDLFFGPIEGCEVWLHFDSEVDWAKILAEAGVFASRTQAIKNGIKGKPKDGFTFPFKIGKANWRIITILKWR